MKIARRKIKFNWSHKSSKIWLKDASNHNHLFPNLLSPHSPQNNCHHLLRSPDTGSALVKTTRRNVSWRLIKRFFRLIKMIIDQVSWRGLTLEHIRKLMGVLGLTLHQTSHTGLTEKMCRGLVKLFYSIYSFWAHFIDLTSSLTWRHDEEWF